MVFQAATDPDIEPNAGCYRAITINAPKGSIVNPHFPAACTGGNEVTCVVHNTVFRALASIPTGKDGSGPHVMACDHGSSNNMIISHPAGIVIDFECAPDETFQVFPDAGILAHANHWQSPVALSKLKDTGIATTPDSLYRDLRVRQLVTPHRGRVTTDLVKEALLDTFQSPRSVCRPPFPSLSGMVTATVAMVVMTPSLGRMEVAMLPAADRTFTAYRLDREEAAFEGTRDGRVLRAAE